MKKFFTAFILASGIILHSQAQRATIPFFEDFNPITNGVWDYGMESGTGIVTTSGADDALEMSSCCLYGTSGVGYANLLLDLTDPTGPVYLDFDWRVVGDCFGENDDGVYLSDDDGNTFVKVPSLPLPDAVSFQDPFESVSINLTALASQNNLSLNDQFIVRFRAHIGSEQQCSRWVQVDNANLYINCPGDTTLTDTISSETVEYVSSGTITASNLISNNSDVIYDAGEAVILAEGFHAQSGVSFLAKIGGCTLPTTSGRSVKEIKTIKGVSDAPDITFSIYPNPVEDELYITLPAKRELLKVSIYNILGEHVATAKTTTIPVSNLAEGMYFVEIQLTDGEGITKKIIVSRE